MTFFKKFYWIRVIIFLLIPILLSIWLFVLPYTFEFPRINETTINGNVSKTGQILKYPLQTYDATKGIIVPTETYKSLALYFLTDVLKIPLEFRFVDYCFKDRGTFIEYYTIRGSQFNYSNFNWTLNFNNEVNHTILRNGRQCLTINTTKQFTYNWALNGDIIFKRGFTKGLSFYTDTTSYGRKNLIEILRLSFTFTLAWMVIFWVLYNVWNVLHKPGYRLK